MMTAGSTSSKRVVTRIILALEYNKYGTKLAREKLKLQKFVKLDVFDYNDSAVIINSVSKAVQN